ncbi:hypothetical protein PbB2_01826 [Candidatus Phycosocius bacilliformis]|uniref:Uncharacterized protein n=1 Tax=Candidatus Phycosocius bacilliformis TaxID=1445552 RepID=A0A2P2EAR8_9PROT|nr:hypothetical protein PbB2_01826 [Candidatus Phycosocius bacilliformis]
MEAAVSQIDGPVAFASMHLHSEAVWLDCLNSQPTRLLSMLQFGNSLQTLKQNFMQVHLLMILYCRLKWGNGGDKDECNR